MIKLDRVLLIGASPIEQQKFKSEFILNGITLETYVSCDKKINKFIESINPELILISEEKGDTAIQFANKIKIKYPDIIIFYLKNSEPFKDETLSGKAISTTYFMPLNQTQIKELIAFYNELKPIKSSSHNAIKKG